MDGGVPISSGGNVARKNSGGRGVGTRQWFEHVCLRARLERRRRLRRGTAIVVSRGPTLFTRICSRAWALRTLWRFLRDQFLRYSKRFSRPAIAIGFLGNGSMGDWG